jgi:Uma2 family endonuclease
MTLSTKPELVYPDSDGQPMADNTLQFRWIVLVKENLECLFAQNPDVFIAGDLLWYPVEGRPDIRVAPDAMVVFGRPKGDRGSYQQWQEDNITPQVVFEILSPGNTPAEMARKLTFYDRYGIDEYYIYDPDHNRFSGFIRQGDTLTVIDPIQNWVSPRLGIRYVLTADTLEIYTPQGERFRTTLELAEQFNQAQLQADQERERANQESQRAMQERERAEQEKSRADKLAAQLRALGIEPEG